MESIGLAPEVSKYTKLATEKISKPSNLYQRALWDVATMATGLIVFLLPELSEFFKEKIKDIKIWHRNKQK